MKALLPITLLVGLTGCQLISPIFVEYNGVRRDVAKWINQQTLLSMQQKRSLAQLSRAQQQLKSFPSKDSQTRLQITKENQIAMHCAGQYLSDKKIQQLQNQIFDNDQAQILQKYEQLAPQIKLDSASIQCE